MKNLITLLSILFLFSCNNSSKNDLKSVLDEKIRYRGNLNSNKYGDFNDNNIIGSLKLVKEPNNISLSDFFGSNGKQYEIKIIDTEKISFPYPTLLNDVEVCCSYDTTVIFSEIINNKKYLFIPHQYISKEEYGSYSFNTIFELTSPKSNYSKKRIEINLPMWGLKIGDYIDKNEIDTSVYNLLRKGSGSIKYQFLKSNNNIKISTLEFENSKKLLITHIENDNLTETEFNSFIDYIKSKYPYLIINKSFSDESISHTNYTINYYGLMIRFLFTDYNVSSGLKTYSFEISDNYTISKRIIENEGKKFIYKVGQQSID